ncbi:MAG: T9SS type A sorting domain-containing protein, partial [Paludibacteraceae bacterium]|nr:T9SS type A sorting domain-containing protein [Paludibacteraceae bacterium]
STINYQLSAYPNPCRNIINIEGIDEEALISIYNLQGMLIQHSTTPTISVENLTPGAYIIRSGTKNTKFIKQ